MGTISANVSATQQRNFRRSLLIVAIEIWGVIALLCLVASSVSHAQAIPAVIYGLGLCDETPCYLDILPGKTRWDEAQNLMENFPAAKKLGATSYANLPGFQGTLLLIPNQDGLTQEIVLSASDNTTLIGGAVLQLGSPCAAVRLGRDDLGLFYPGISIISRMKKIGSYFVLRPTSPVTRAILSNQVASCSDIGLDRTRADFRWHGFMRYAENGE